MTHGVCHTQFMTYTDRVVIDDLSKQYGDHRVLDKVSVRISGGIVALLGPNGAGKTTLISVLSTLIAPSSGRVAVFGHDVVTDAGAVRGLIGLTGQEAAVDEVLTGTENLILMGRLYGLSKQVAGQRAGSLLERFGLAEAADRRVSTYSGGMRRRLDLAINLLVSPALLVLDEPTTGLDPTSRQALWDEIKTIAAAGTTVLLTTQYLQEADALADRVLILNDGGIVADGSPAELKARVGGEVVEVLDELGRVTESIITDGTVSGARTALATLPDHAKVALRQPSLDEVFSALTNTKTSKERIPA